MIIFNSFNDLINLINLNIRNNLNIFGAYLKN